MSPAPPLAPDELVSAAGERDVLETFLDLYRDIVVRKVSGLSTVDASRRLVPSRTTLAGLVRHLTGVEREWFHGVLGGRPAPGGDRASPAAQGTSGVAQDGSSDSWDVPGGASVESLVADYRAACATSREICAGFALDDTVPSPRLGRVSLRWLYVHLIEETARHAGHADILREQTDGATGFDG
ncbi:DinB family protein [Dactylosporangium sp. NPDC050588]|uniref:DinB family protein n=1 Tax=Dactylosporangium sp. NPDC050588 TaxID=3157211 RepID=UPI0033F93AE3